MHINLFFSFQLHSFLGVRFNNRNEKTKNLPCITICPVNAFKSKGFHFATDIFENQTYSEDEILMNVTSIQAYNSNLYKVETLRSILFGRCYTITYLTRMQKRLSAFYPLTKNVDLTGLPNMFDSLV